MAKEKKEKPEGEEAEEAGGGKKKLIIMIAVPAVLIAGGAGFFLRSGDAEETTPTTVVVEEGEVIDVETMTVNLVGEEGRYARVGFAVVLDALADSGAVGQKTALMRDATLTVMTQFDSTELQTRDGMERLRVALTDSIVVLFADGEVIRVVLTELIVQ